MAACEASHNGERGAVILLPLIAVALAALSVSLVAAAVAEPASLSAPVPCGCVLTPALDPPGAPGTGRDTEGFSPEVNDVGLPDNALRTRWSQAHAPQAPGSAGDAHRSAIESSLQAETAYVPAVLSGGIDLRHDLAEMANPRHFSP